MQVGMRLNRRMVGTTDFQTPPAVEKAALAEIIG
jgi:hypothetical protein